MRRHVCWALTLVSFLPGSAAAEDASNAAVKPKLVIGAERGRKLAQALLEKPGTHVPWRAVQELSLAGRIDSACAEGLIDLLKGHPWTAPWAVDAAIALSGLGRDVLPLLIEGLKQHPVDDKGTFLLIAIGRMGTQAKEAIPHLREIIARPETPLARQLEARVVLACVGGQTPENLEIIVSNIEQRTEAGAAAVQMMAYCKAKEWVTAPLVSSIGKWLAPRDDNALYAAMALGALGPAASAQVDELRAAVAKFDEKRELLGRACLMTCLAAVEGEKKGQDDLRRAVRLVCRSNMGWRHITYCGISLARTVLNGAMVSSAASLLRDRDPEVVCGAVLLGGSFWTQSPDAADALMGVVKSPPEMSMDDEEDGPVYMDSEILKLCAANALCMVAPYSRLAALEALLEQERKASDEMSAAHQLERSIAIIRLDAAKVERLDREGG